MAETSFCIEFVHNGEKDKNEIKKELYRFVQLMVDMDSDIFDYDLRGCI